MDTPDPLFSAFQSLCSCQRHGREPAGSPSPPPLSLEGAAPIGERASTGLPRSRQEAFWEVPGFFSPQANLLVWTRNFWVMVDPQIMRGGVLEVPRAGVCGGACGRGIGDEQPGGARAPMEDGQARGAPENQDPVGL